MPPAAWDNASNDLDDHEYPDADLWDEDDTDTVVCPACGADVYEDADQCPKCGEFLISDTRIWCGKPTWWIVLGLLGMIAVIALLALGA